jgi:thiamine pyridinylase
MRKSCALLCSATLLLAGCATPAEQPATVTATPVVAALAQKFVLRVSLFPWIPEKEAFASWIEGEFEKENPGIDVVIRPMDKANTDAGDLSYDYDLTVKALMDAQSPDHQDLVEVDTIILGKLVEAGAVQPVSIESGDYYDFARRAVTIDGKVYGVPHWSCGYFIITTEEGVATAGTGEQLKAALVALGTASPDLGGDVIGSWGSVVSYADAFVDSYPQGDLATALRAPTLDPGVASSLAAVGSACNSSGTGLCNRDDDDLVRQFGAKRLDALIGYSERLNVLFSDPGNMKPRDRIKITPAPLGAGKNAFFFTDALVRSSACTSVQCQDSARKFAAFYSSATIMADSIMAADKGKGAVPRYLLSANREAMQQPAVAHDPIYRQLSPLLDSALPYPNQGIPEARASGSIRKAVDALLQPARP